MSASYRISRAIARVLFFLFAPIRVEIGDALPDHGAAILCANHQTLADPVAIACAFVRPIRFLAKAELFAQSLFGRYMTSLGMIPVHRGKSDLRAVRQSIDCLGQADMLGIFPEGTRADGDVPFQTGIALIALKTGAPVYPVRILKRIRPFRFTRIRVGARVDLSDLAGKLDSDALRRATGRIEDALRSL